MLAVSHDRYFINRMATRVMQLTPDGLENVGADYDAYAAAARMAAAAPPPAEKPVKVNDYKLRKERESTIRRLTTAVRRAEEQVAQLEQEIADLSAQLESPDVAADFEKLTALTADLDAKNDALAAQMEAWENYQMELEELTAENC
jgi:ATP-binding cassette subfamily F protein 3